MSEASGKRGIINVAAILLDLYTISYFFYEGPLGAMRRLRAVVSFTLCRFEA